MNRSRSNAGEVIVRAPAKVNLFLKILGRRPDGFHSLVSVFHTVGVWDEISISRARYFKFTAQGLPVPRGDDNLCARAYRLLSSEARFKTAVRIHLIKRIPLGAGLGGGSSDAAACLLGLDRALDLKLGSRRLLKLAARLGSDVPFFLMGKAALGRGRGERLAALPSRLKAWAVILKPYYSVSTKLAYRAFDRRRDRSTRSTGALAGLCRAIAHGSLSGLEVINDFTEIVDALHPKNRFLLDGLRDAGLKPAFLSGSGSAVVGIGKNRRHGAAAARKLGRRFKVSACLARLAPYTITIKRS